MKLLVEQNKPNQSMEKFFESQKWQLARERNLCVYNTLFYKKVVNKKVVLDFPNP